jgi:hypothetical protein
MGAPHETWTVLPHGPLEAVDANIMTVVGEIKLPTGQLPRRMTVVRLADRRLVVFSAIALRDSEMKRLEEFGTPAFLIVPNAIHRMDARIWKGRYPAMQVITPRGARSNVSEIVHVDAVDGEFGDPSVSFVSVPGTQDGESALVVKGPSGTTLVINDLIGNIHGTSGFGGWLLRLMKFAGDTPHVPLPVKFKLVKDRSAFKAQLLRWADIADLRRILVSHGSTIETDPHGTLRTLADSLG